MERLRVEREEEADFGLPSCMVGGRVWGGRVGGMLRF